SVTASLLLHQLSSTMPPSIGNERIQKMYVQMRGLPVFGNVDKRFHIGYSYFASFKEGLAR
ncbi:hypothetical protein ABG818_11165, partial [Bifidobacterium adolescentis]